MIGDVRPQIRRLWCLGSRHEAFSHGVRAFLALASVTAGGWWLDQAPAVIPLLLGVIASALAETDDSWRGRLRAQLITLLCFALIAFAVQASLLHPGLLAGVLVLAAFSFTLLGALGERYRAMAFASLILSIYTALAAHTDGSMTRWQVLALLAGAAWYGLISVLWAAALPMLPVRQNLSRLYRVLAEYLHLKSALFEPVRGIDLERRRLALAMHNGRVVEALNATKESLFSRLGTSTARPWLCEAMHQYFMAQDVHERVSSSHEHYEVLAEAFFHSDVLYRCQRVLALLGQDCQMLAQAIVSDELWCRDDAAMRSIEDLGAAIRHMEAGMTGEGARGPLRALHALAENLKAIEQDVAGAQKRRAQAVSSDNRILDHQPRTMREAWLRVRAQLSLSSALMRHAIRLSVALAAGYLVMLASAGSHGFWILLTIVFVCQPQYGATLTRLVQRIGGTVLGLVIGWALLRLFPELLVQSAFTVAAGVLFFVSRQSHYLLATAAITSLVLLSFNQVGDGYGLIVPRLLDTLAGGIIAGLAVWLVLPSWQSRQLHRVAAQVVRAQSEYLREIMAQYQSGKRDHLAYRLARRNAHNADAALSGALSAMSREPDRVRCNAQAGMRFLVLSHTVLNYLSALGAHRDVRLILRDEDAPQRAAAFLLSTLDALAGALESGQSLPVPAAPAETDMLDRLTLKNDPALSDAQRGLQAQLLLALRLLPALREQAALLMQAGGKPVTMPGV
jgi:YccS/YhfK family integral membrane protein